MAPNRGTESSTPAPDRTHGTATFSVEIGLREEFPAGVASSSPSIPSGLEKVFRIAQLLVRYLLHSQERLAEALETVQAANRSLTEVCREDFDPPNNNHRGNITPPLDREKWSV